MLRMFMKKYPLTIPYILEKKIKSLEFLTFFKQIPSLSFLDFIILMNPFTEYDCANFLEIICTVNYYFVEERSR